MSEFYSNPHEYKNTPSLSRDEVSLAVPPLLSAKRFAQDPLSRAGLRCGSRMSSPSYLQPRALSPRRAFLSAIPAGTLSVPCRFVCF